MRCVFILYLISVVFIGSISILVIFKFNNQKNTLKTTLNKHQCLFKVVFGVIFWLLNLKVAKVQSNFDCRTNSGFPNHPAGPGLLYTATVENLHSIGLRRWPQGVGARDDTLGGLRGVVRGEDNVLRAGADPGEIMLRN